MRLTRREFAKLLALGLGAGAAAGAAGLPPLARAALAAPGGKGLAVALDPALPVHPALQYGALAEPDKVVRVLVQTVLPQDDGRAIAAAHGAAHREEFAFVKSHVFELPQRAVPRLGLHPHVLYVSPDGPVQRHATTIATTNLKTIYPLAIRADAVWNGNPAATGAGVTVAVLDTGVDAGLPDFTNPSSRGAVIAVNTNTRTTSAADPHGHGTHVAGIVKGRSGTGSYIGIAPDCTLLSVKVADDQGVAHESDLLRGLQWCYDHRAGYGGSGAIRIVNLSVCSGTPHSYRTSPVCAAAEQLWLNGVVVVVAAGNRGTASDATWYPPANDPYVVTVGALDDGGTAGPGDDTLAVFSGRGTTQDGVYKPDLVAPGRRVVSTLAASTSALGQEFASRITGGSYLRLSGTSMAAPVVAGVVAQVLQTFPAMQPDQVKWLLLKVANPFATSPDGVRVVDPVEAQTYAKSNPWQRANQGLTPNSGIKPSTGTVDWGNAYWDNAYWDNAYWDNAYWDVATSYD